MSAACFCVALLLSCGKEGDSLAVVSLSFALEDRVASLEIFVLSDVLSDGAPLDCDLLQARDPLFFDQVVPLSHVFVARGETIRFRDLPADRQLVVAVNAYETVDGSGIRVGFGCAAGVRLQPAATPTRVEIDVGP